MFLHVHIPLCGFSFINITSLNKRVYALKKDSYRSRCPAASWGCPPPLSWWSPPLCSGSGWTAEPRQCHWKYKYIQYEYNFFFLVFTAVLFNYNSLFMRSREDEMCCQTTPTLCCFLSIFQEVICVVELISPHVLSLFVLISQNIQMSYACTFGSDGKIHCSKSVLEWKLKMFVSKKNMDMMFLTYLSIIFLPVISIYSLSYPILSYPVLSCCLRQMQDSLEVW